MFFPDVAHCESWFGGPFWAVRTVFGRRIDGANFLLVDKSVTLIFALVIATFALSVGLALGVSIVSDITTFVKASPLIDLRRSFAWAKSRNSGVPALTCRHDALPANLVTFAAPVSIIRRRLLGSAATA